MAIHKTCGTCRSIEHATKNCNLHDDMSKHTCVNCKETSYATWSRDCLTLRKKNREILENSYEGSFKYFVTDDPSTWEYAIDDIGQLKQPKSNHHQTGFQLTHVDWGYGHNTLPGQAPPRIMVNNNRQTTTGPNNMQVSLHEYRFQDRPYNVANDNWYPLNDYSNPQGWDGYFAPELLTAIIQDTPMNTTPIGCNNGQEKLSI
jgi:hypothetical protein